MATQPKPSLKEIAAMPFPASLNAMREHYNPAWGKPIPDGAEGKQTFAVEVTYTISGRETVEVEAWSEKEAMDLAAELVADEADVPPRGDIEIEDTRIVKPKGTEA